MKLIYLIIGLFCTIGVGSAGINDTNFSIYNEGSVSYFVYMHGYTGDDPSHYQDSYVGELLPSTSMSLNDNASYKLYAEYNDVCDIASIETVENYFNRWWFIILVMLIVVIGLVALYRVIKQ